MKGKKEWETGTALPGGEPDKLSRGKKEDSHKMAVRENGGYDKKDILAKFVSGLN